MSWKPVPPPPPKSKEQVGAEYCKKLASQVGKTNPKLRATLHGMSGHLTRMHNKNQKKAGE